MEGGVGSSTEVLIRGQAHGWNHIFNFINSMSLKCAVELRIPDIIHGHGGAIALHDLATALGIPSHRVPALRRLMRMLEHSRFFATKSCRISQDEAGGEVSYVLTDASRLLLSKNPASMSNFVLAMLDPVLVNPWHFWSKWFRGDEPTPFEVAHGGSVWEVFGRRPEFGNLFNEAMAGDARFLMSLVVKECGDDVFGGLRSLVDVGGGTGAGARVIAEAYPHVKCSVLDLPQVADSFLTASNVNFIAGDMFEHIPSADAVLLKWIMHDWDDESCVKILERCKEAIPSKEEGGKVIILDMVVNNSASSNCLHEFIETQIFFDMLMMVNTPGKERDANEWHKIFKDAGFSGYKVIRSLGVRSVIEVYP